MASKPTLLLVHGAWHSPECFHKIVPLLEDQGYKCVVPTMLYTTQEPPVRSNKPDIDLVQSLIKSELAANTDVVMVAHSFGGVAACSAVQGLSQKDSSRVGTGSGRVKGIVIISGVLLPTGVTAIDGMGGQFPPFSKPNFETGWADINGDPVDLFYHDIPADEAASCVSSLAKLSVYTHTSSEGVYAGWLDVPVWFLYCTEDRAVLPAWQEAAVSHAREAGGNITTRSLDCGHSSFLAKPKETVDFILEAVKSFD